MKFILDYWDRRKQGAKRDYMRKKRWEFPLEPGTEKKQRERGGVRLQPVSFLFDEISLQDAIDVPRTSEGT